MVKKLVVVMDERIVSFQDDPQPALEHGMADGKHTYNIDDVWTVLNANEVAGRGDNLGPTWLAEFGNPYTREPLNRTADETAEAARHMIDYSLWIFLCVARPSFNFS